MKSWVVGKRDLKKASMALKMVVELNLQRANDFHEEEQMKTWVFLIMRGSPIDKLDFYTPNAV